MNDTYALIRVSSGDQNVARQVVTMKNLGIPDRNIVIEKESGKNTERLKYHRLVKRLKTGDTLYIENVDRLARDYDNILFQWHFLTKQKDVILKVLDTPMLDTDQSLGDLTSKYMRDILLISQAYQSESEWIKIKTRQAQGIAVAKASGIKFGRPKTVTTEKDIKTIKQYLNRKITIDTALSQLHLKKTAFYNLCKSIRDIC